MAVQTLAEQVAADLAGIVAGPETVAESVTYTPKGGVAVASVAVVFAVDSKTDAGAVSGQRDGQGATNVRTVTLMDGEIADPGINDTLTRTSGEVWVVKSASMEHGIGVLEVERYKQVSKTRKDYYIERSRGRR